MLAINIPGAQPLRLARLGGVENGNLAPGAGIQPLRYHIYRHLIASFCKGSCCIPGFTDRYPLALTITLLSLPKRPREHNPAPLAPPSSSHRQQSAKIKFLEFPADRPSEKPDPILHPRVVRARPYGSQSFGHLPHHVREFLRLRGRNPLQPEALRLQTKVFQH